MTIFELVTPVLWLVAFLLLAMSVFGDKSKSKDRKFESVFWMCMAFVGAFNIVSSHHRKLKDRVEALEKSAGVGR